jgi:hypothetical protein
METFPDAVHSIFIRLAFFFDIVDIEYQNLNTKND